jgi:hypothetical protein
MLTPKLLDFWGIYFFQSNAVCRITQYAWQDKQNDTSRLSKKSIWIGTPCRYLTLNYILQTNSMNRIDIHKQILAQKVKKSLPPRFMESQHEKSVQNRSWARLKFKSSNHLQWKFILILSSHLLISPSCLHYGFSTKILCVFKPSLNSDRFCPSFVFDLLIVTTFVEGHTSRRSSLSST